MTKLAVVLAAVALTACNTARTAYSLDHTKSWMCAPNTKVQYPPLQAGGEPMVMLETAQEQKIAQQVLDESRKAAQASAPAQVASAPK